MDTLSEFFERIHLQGRLFYAGRVQGTLNLDKPAGTVFIHMIEKGGIDLVQPGMPKIAINEPSLLLCPGTCRYQLRSRSAEGADIICASFEFGTHMGPAFPLGLTETMIFPFAALEYVESAVTTLIAEFRGQAAGRQKALNVLFEYIFILLVRRAVELRLISDGVLYAMLDGKLSNALSAMHNEPERDWGLMELAERANMSRSKFAACFMQILGVSPIVYLTAWRMKLAQDLLRQGVQIKIIASTVGYSSQAAFTRTFTHLIGAPPSEWLKLHSTRLRI